MFEKLRITSITVLFLVILAPDCFAEWTIIKTDDNGSHYLDFDSVRYKGSFVYFWKLRDYEKDIYEEMSSKVYIEGDCSLFRYRFLIDKYYTLPMGQGMPSVINDIPETEWTSPSANALSYLFLTKVCRNN